MPDRLPNGADEFNLPEPHVIPTQKAPPHGRFLILTFPCSAIRIRFHSGMPCKFILTYLAKRLIPHIPPCRKSQNKKEGKFPSKWRRERDSNSRKACAFDGFQDRCNQPLCHLSNNFSTYPSELRSDDGLRLNRGAYAPCSPISASLRCQDRCNQPLCHLSNNFSTYPSELRSDDGLRLNRGAYAPCSPISASLRCQDRCNQLLSFKTTEAVLVCTQNSPKGQEFFKNYLRLPIRRR